MRYCLTKHFGLNHFGSNKTRFHSNSSTFLGGGRRGSAYLIFELLGGAYLRGVLIRERALIGHSFIYL